jgi:hypothetical protein
VGAGLALILVGLAVLLPGRGHAAYPIACLVAGAAWLAVTRLRRTRSCVDGEPAAAPGPARRAFAILAELTDALAVFAVAGFAFEHPTRGPFSGLALDPLIGATVCGVILVYASARLRRIARGEGTSIVRALVNAALRCAALFLALSVLLFGAGALIDMLAENGPASGEAAVAFFAAWACAGLAAPLAGYVWRERLSPHAPTRLLLHVWSALGMLTVAAAVIAALATLPRWEVSRAAALFAAAVFGLGAVAIARRGRLDLDTGRAGRRCAVGLAGLAVALVGARSLVALVAYTSDVGALLEAWRIMILIYPLVFLAAGGLASAAAWIGASIAVKAALPNSSPRLG